MVDEFASPVSELAQLETPHRDVVERVDLNQFFRFGRAKRLHAGAHCLRVRHPSLDFDVAAHRCRVAGDSTSGTLTILRKTLPGKSKGLCSGKEAERHRRARKGRPSIGSCHPRRDWPRASQPTAHSPSPCSGRQVIATTSFVLTHSIWRPAWLTATPAVNTTAVAIRTPC
jgi:hypothetical protein